MVMQQQVHHGRAQLVWVDGFQGGGEPAALSAPWSVVVVSRQSWTMCSQRAEQLWRRVHKTRPRWPLTSEGAVLKGGELHTLLASNQPNFWMPPEERAAWILHAPSNLLVDAVGHDPSGEVVQLVGGFHSKPVQPPRPS